MGNKSDNRHLDYLHEEDDDILYIYTDGSRELSEDKECIRVSGAYLFVLNDEVIHSGRIEATDKSNCAAWNVGGEMLACLKGLKKAVETYPITQKIVIVHDYIGVASWGNHLWKTSHKSPDAAIEFIKELDCARANGYEISFIKIKSHTTTKNKACDYNRKVDELAGIE